MDERDRRARREGFLASNFEMHRSAMLEMQELVRDCFDAFWTEKQRRINEGFYQYFEDFPLKGQILKMAYKGISMEETMTAIINASSDEERHELTKDVKAITEKIKAVTEEAEKVKSEIDNLGAVLETLYPFWKVCS